MAVLEELQQAVARAADAASPAVVGIGGQWRRGSGIVVGPGRVLTNAHNVHRDEVTCVFADGRRATATLRGLDADGDLAVLEVDTGDVKPLPWGAEAPAIGSVVFAVASSAGGGVRTTAGLVSAVERSFRGPGGRRIGGSVEHTAPLVPGSSGSPLLDAEGRLVGINTHRIGEGFYLALPADAALRERVDALGRGESTARPRLGIAVAPAAVAHHLRRSVGLPERDGVLVRGVEPESPAARAGIREGDLIVSANGNPLADADDLHDVLGRLTRGAKLEVVVVRGVDESTIGVAFTEPAGTGESGTSGASES